VQSEYPESAADDEIASRNNMNSLEGTPSRMPVESQGSLIDTSAVLDPSKFLVSYTSKITLLLCYLHISLQLVTHLGHGIVK